MEIKIHPEIELAIDRYYRLCEYGLVSNATGQEIVPQNLVWAIIDKRVNRVLIRGNILLCYGTLQGAEEQENEVGKLFPEMLENTRIVPFFLLSAEELGMPSFRK